MRNRESKRKSLPIFLLAAATPLCLATPARSQTQSNPDANRPAQAQQTNATPRNSDITRPEVAEFDRFLDGHPEISDQLKRDPALLNNGSFVDSHPALDKYLDSHPEARSQMQQNPYAFMHMENRFDRNEAGQVRGGDIDRDRFTRFREFSDNHRQVAEQLRRNPALANDRDFVAHHGELQTYWREHPEDRDAMRQDPHAFMRDADRFNRGEFGGAAGPTAGTTHDADRERAASFHEFLGSHSDVARDVDRRHDLVNDHNYVDHHRELNAYLNSHPDVREQWTKNPDNFVKNAHDYTNSSAGVKATTTTNPSGASTGAGAGSSGTTGGTTNRAPSGASAGAGTGTSGTAGGTTSGGSNPTPPTQQPHNKQPQ